MHWPLINPEFNTLITFLGEIQYQIAWHRLYYFIAITLMMGNIIVLVFVICYLDDFGDLVKCKCKYVIN